MLPKVNDTSEVSIDIVDWKLEDLFNPEFIQSIDALIEESNEQMLPFQQDFSSVNPELTRTQKEKISKQYWIFLWTLTSNKIKYYFLFDIEMFTNFLSILSDTDYELFRRLILSLQTVDLERLLLQSPIYQSFVSQFTFPFFNGQK
jgi:hypothetical protein